MTITVNHSVTVTLPHTATIADLAALVDAAEKAGLPASSRIRVDKYAGDQRDPGYTRITVTES